MEEPFQQTVPVVDDEAWVRTYVWTALQREGFQVLEAADGLDALALLLQGLGRAVEKVPAATRQAGDFILTIRSYDRQTGDK